jgi:RNA polymerase sigma factor (sigma-70 family)
MFRFRTRILEKNLILRMRAATVRIRLQRIACPMPRTPPRIQLHAPDSSLGKFHVTDDTSAELQDLIDRLRSGDDSARRELLQRAHDRLLRIAATIFKEDFPGLRGRHDLESVVSDVWLRLAGALVTVHPETVDGFFGLVFQKVRHVLLDMAARQRRDDRRGQALATDPNDPDGRVALDPSDTTDEPTRLAALTEFHRQVEKLPDDERAVFELHYYGEFSQAEIAQIRQTHAKQVSRLWLAATRRLAKWLDTFDAAF